MKKFIKTFILAGGAFGLIMGMATFVVMSLIFGINKGLSFGIVAGLGTGLAFGLTMSGFATLASKGFQHQKSNLEGEIVVHDGPANHFLNSESVGGWLFLTDKRILFRSHAINVQTHEWSAPLPEIAETKASATLGIIPNGLKIILTSGQTETFVVEDHKKWQEKVISAKNHSATHGLTMASAGGTNPAPK